MNTVNIAFCINDGYVPQLITVLVSIMHNIRNRDVHAYVFSSDITSESRAKITKLCSGLKNLEIDFVHIDADAACNLPRNIDYISAETYYRYLIADALPQLDKILYLDADIVVNGDLGPLYDTDVSSNIIAGAPDAYIDDIKHKSSIGFKDSDLYVNAGVLLMNLDRIRTDKMAAVWIAATTDLADKIKFQDQDVINITCRGQIGEFDSIYNYTSHNIRTEPKKFRHAVIIHYTGSNKPWLPDSRHKMRGIYQKYQNKAEKIMTKKIKVALLIDEFFGGAGTAFGGYGALARKYIAKYIPCDDIEIDVLLGRGKHKRRCEKYHVDDVDLYRLPKRKFWARRFLRHKNYDIYLSIELTNDYVLRHEPNKNKKLILWIQDPRPWYEWREIETVSLFPETNFYTQHIYDTVNKLYNRNLVRFLSQGYFLNTKACDLYRLPSNVNIQYMPNPVDIDNNFNVSKHKKKDNIIFLGRIESVKRGWLFCEIAKKLPEYNFYVLGQSFREKDQNNKIMKKYMNIPNLHFAGHVDGDEKAQYLKDAKILVNTSIHEALPISFLEALSYGINLVSNRNPEDLTSKFGIWVGNVLGDGFDKIDLYVDAIRELMTNNDTRIKNAVNGRKYVEKIHNIPRFVNDMRNVIYKEAK